MSRHSKIPLQILSLYRSFLRVAKHKPGAMEYVRHEFRQNAAIPKTDSVRIEHLLRRGERQIKDFSNPSITSVGVFQSDSKDEEHRKKTKWKTVDSNAPSWIEEYELFFE